MIMSGQRAEVTERRIVSVNGKVVLTEGDDGKWSSGHYDSRTRAAWEIVRIALNRLAHDEPIELAPAETEVCQPN